MTDISLPEQTRRVLVLFFLLVMLALDPLPATRSSLLAPEPVVVCILPQALHRTRRRRRFSQAFSMV
jgi:hypothetical protein